MFPKILWLNLPADTPSEYTRVPFKLKDREILPSVSDIPILLTNMRHPRRRAVSVGPQSAADAYETLAYREKRRRESESSGTIQNEGKNASALNVDNPNSSKPSTPTRPNISAFEQMMGQGTVLQSSTNPPGTRAIVTYPRTEDLNSSSGDQEEVEMLSKLEKPRVRYDVEVVTRLVVYAG